MLYDHQFILLLIHLISTSLMVGIIWVIQVVHYPSFHFIGNSRYISFQKFHMERISYIVIPVMLVESISGFLLIYDELNLILLISMVLLLSIWMLTAFFFASVHQKLVSGYQLEMVTRLVKINWIRTLLWTLRLLLLIIYFTENFINA